MMQPTVTLGVSAFNEAESIGALLDSVCRQKLGNITLARVLVISDCSTDATDSIVRSYSNRLPIHLVVNKSRMGQPVNINKIFRLSGNTDIVAYFDADVVLGHSHSLYHLVLPLLRNPSVGLVCANPQPKPPRTWVEAAVYTSFMAYDSMRYELNSGHTVYSLKGCSFAIRKNLAKKIVLPPNFYATDGYIYFRVLQEGYKFRFSPKSLIHFRLPSTVADHLKQNRRWMSSKDKLGKLFGPVVFREYALPKMLFARHALRQFAAHPVSAIQIMFLNLLVKVSLVIKRRSDDPLWSMSLSTRKDLI